MLQSFVGYDTVSLDGAVRDAFKDYAVFMGKYMWLTPQLVSTSTEIHDGECNTEYWFVLTVLYTGPYPESEIKRDN